MAQWTYSSTMHDFTRTGSLELYWEVFGDPYSDDFTFDDISAADLFARWAERYGDENGGLLPIYWVVEPEGETAPFQTEKEWIVEDFLTHWTEPVNATTHAPINWLTLPVVEKKWTAEEFTKGGFIQEATGWKPSPLQPYVTISSLRAAAHVRRDTSS